MTQHQIRIGEDDPFQQDGEDTLLQAALRAGVGFPYECSSGGCGSCKFELLDGEVENLWKEAPGLSERDRRKNLQLACQCRARGPLRIKVRSSPECRPKVRPVRRSARLVSVRAITHDITEFRFVTQRPAEFEAGQYALLYLPGLAAPRAYSMSNIANSDGEWHFQIRRVPGGKGTDRLFNHLQPGDDIVIDGPYGLAGLRTQSARDVVCVAGGSGLAPMVSIARGATQAGMLRERQLHFFYGARTPHDVCGEEFLRALPGFGESIHFHPVVSQPEDAATRWTGATGFVHESVRRVLAERLPDCEFYFAGPPPMTQALQSMLMLDYRVPFEQVHFDRFF
ncbi:MAG TPA: 2Fe-2S iron-sulfur cluster-binding protein [Noviherbaspirillum sp.]|uniref:2Fe-2S iron-sulfur cluster-binding protein n=1 Tax=Noviherbaspirillum sp. TaxID=1926288 RepID=UPI002B4730ED|nr:2Fe-2S iron-sulfur cluster-binding protein [Noviherbaspirillum sp.]HJV84165.1 2Fe-2S iron-sulfur cluster-binding protein [Noviherbaspirillum sp.]